jgi:hypothetical protein
MAQIQDVNFVAKINQIITHFLFYSCSIVVNSFILVNILNILICLRSRIIKEMIGFYNIIISVFNIFTLVLGSLIVYPITLNLQDLIEISNFSCITITYFSRVSVQMCSWLYVFLSLDRYLCVAYNEKFKFLLNNKKKLSFILTGLFVVILLINVPNLFFKLTNVSSFDTRTNQTKSYVLCTATSSVILVRNFIVILFRIALPLLLQIILSILLIYKLFKSRHSVGINRDMKKEYRFTRIIIWINICFIITETPLMVTTLYFGILGLKPEYPLNENSSNSLAISTLIFYVASVLGSYMFGSLFFVNAFTNHIFKKEISLIFNCIRAERQTTTIYNTSSTK